MTDKELLELAAKAAGMEYPSGQTYCETLGVWGMLENCPYHWWNPLTDDGDALRLAVKLQMCVSAPFCYSATAKCADVRTRVTEQEVNNDPYAATRRAIVRVAAEIGKHK